MNISRLKPAQDFLVEKWLAESLKLTPYQIEKMRDDETLRFSPYYFYELQKKEKVSIWWRLTLLFFPLYWTLTLLGYPFTFIFTGKWGYSKKFFDNFHVRWMNKLYN